jgi:hypothetical protein
MNMSRRRLTAEEKIESAKRRKEKQAERYQKNRDAIRTSQKKYAETKNRGSQCLTREETIAEQTALQSERVKINPVQLSRLSGPKLVEAVKEMLK